MFPGFPLRWALFKSLIDKSWWLLYGSTTFHTKVLQGQDYSGCHPMNTSNPDDWKNWCPEPSGVWYTYVGLMIYFLFANVVVISILFAMFSISMRAIQDRADQIWKACFIVFVVVEKIYVFFSHIVWKNKAGLGVQRGAHVLSTVECVLRCV